jgi:hypothetical protein
MIFRRVPVQRLQHKQQRKTGNAGRAGATAPAANREQRQRVPEFHMRGLFAVVPTSDVSPLALRLSDMPSDWRESDAA